MYYTFMGKMRLPFIDSGLLYRFDCNLNVFGKGLIRIATIGKGHVCLREENLSYNYII
jgi:hypothetical protein